MIKLIKDYNLKSGLYGAIVGDALGVPFEFLPREDRDKQPCTTMVGYGTHNQPKGTWSDDTSMILAGLDGLTENIRWNGDDGLNYDFVMRNYMLWLLVSDYTPYNQTWGVGFATYDAIERYIRGQTPLLCGGVGERDNGNGSLMRILPLVYYIYYVRGQFGEEELQMVHNFSSLTHRHKRSQISCGVFCFIAWRILENNMKGWGKPLDELVHNGITNAREYYLNSKMFEDEVHHFNRVWSNDIENLPRDEIKSGGYTVNTLEASIWCLLNNDGYKDTLLEAVNLGGDTDTTGCVCGGLAGLYYGLDSIPFEWLECLVRKSYLEMLMDNFLMEVE